ncbi:MAG: hypothetical protein IJT01_04150, partial [Selenomonadaceae bacterium]|nr:hypothetical protein [Selenomonadaceae bacterium]
MQVVSYDRYTLHGTVKAGCLRRNKNDPPSVWTTVAGFVKESTKGEPLERCSFYAYCTILEGETQPLANALDMAKTGVDSKGSIY